jgi:hypothetical protein
MLVQHNFRLVRHSEWKTAFSGIGVICISGRGLSWLMHAAAGYYDNYLVTIQAASFGVQTWPRLSEETAAAQDMLMRFSEWQGRELEWVVAASRLILRRWWPPILLHPIHHFFNHLVSGDVV